jgi:F-type H+-transporting ATPase subunit alpha
LQVLVIWTATNGHLDDVPVDNVRRFEADLLRFVENSHPGVLSDIREKKSLTDDIKADLGTVIKDFKDRWNEETLVARQATTSDTTTPTTTSPDGAATSTVAAGA